MATNAELKIVQKTALYDLLMLKMENEKSGVNLVGLNRLINKTKAVMEAEDVAYVEKMIEQL